MKHLRHRARALLSIDSSLKVPMKPYQASYDRVSSKYNNFLVKHIKMTINSSTVPSETHQVSFNRMFSDTNTPPISKKKSVQNPPLGKTSQYNKNTKILNLPPAHDPME